MQSNLSFVNKSYSVEYRALKDSLFLKSLIIDLKKDKENPFRVDKQAS